MVKGRDLRREWLVAGSALFVAAVLVLFGTLQAAQQPKESEFSITVVPYDARALECRSSTEFDGLHCGPVTEASSSSSTLLRPYVTVAGEMLLIAGVFQQKEVLSWLEHARRNRLEERITLQCRGRLLGRMLHVEVRFHIAEAFGPAENLAALRVEECRVSAQR